MVASQRASLLPGAENHRHGRVSGDGGLTKIVRTFHARFGSVKMGAGQTARTRIAYVHREGQHAKDAGDVEAIAGDKEAVIAAADRIRDTARVRRGKTAERILATQVVELPMESTAEQRQACADAFVADWRERGHQAVAAVHVHGEDRPQPHLHVEIAARPVHADGAVDRSELLWHGREPVKKERGRVADLVNRTCDPDPPYHPGGFRDIGVERQPRTRIPSGRFRAAREEIREARAANDTDEAARIEAKAYAVSDQERGGKRDARVARTAEIIEFKAAGLPARPSQRARLAFAEPALKAERDRAGAVREAHAATVARAVQGLEQAGEWLGEARARADGAEASVATLTDEKRQAETRADRAEGRVGELEELNAVQTKYVTDWHGDHNAELPDLAAVEGLSLAWANMRAWKAEARKKAEDEAAAKEAAEQALEAERDSTEEKIAEAVRRALETEPDPAPPGPADLPVPEAPPAAVPAEAAQPDLPATWTLPLGELMKAGDEVGLAAAKKWLMKDSSPTSMPLDGIADSPVLTFTPERGLFRKQPASWRYEDTGRYAGEAAIELAVLVSADRNLDAPNWRAAAEALSRVLVTDALKDGAEPPGWLQNTFQDLDEEYGPKIRTRKYHGEHARTYVGEMSGGEPHGAGTETWTSGTRYEGAFKNGHRHGQGVMTYADGNRYEGAWQKGHRHGQGVYDFADGRRYEGEWRDGLRHGQGIQTWSDGQRYEGAFENDARHGQGVYDFADGRRYEGGWKAGERHGPGIETTADGKRTEGVWEDGKRAEAAEAARQKALAPAREERAAKLRKEFRDDQRDIGMHRDALAQANAWRIHGAERAALEAAEGRQKARRAEAAKLGIELQPKKPRAAARDRERGDGRG